MKISILVGSYDEKTTKSCLNCYVAEKRTVSIQIIKDIDPKFC